MSKLEPSEGGRGVRARRDRSFAVSILSNLGFDRLADDVSPSRGGAAGFSIVMPVPHLFGESLPEDGQIQLMGGVRPLDAGLLKIRLDGHPPQDSSLAVRVDSAARDRIQLYRYEGAKWESLGTAGAWRFPGSEYGDSELILSLVSDSFARGPSGGSCAWNGHITLSATLEGRQHEKLAQAVAHLRVAPFLLASALDPVEKVLVVSNDRTARFVEALSRVLSQIGVELCAIGVEGGTESDVWIQDAVEIGRVCVPTPKGVQQAVAVLGGIRSGHQGINCEPLDRHVREHFHHRGAIVIDAAVPRKSARWTDWYGNLEVSPPVRDREGREFPFGRVLTGVQDGLGMHPDILSFLEAQSLQTPPLIIDTSWLCIGHVDEVVSFVPSDNRGVFQVLIPSPALASDILERAAVQGFGTRLVFAGHTGETTVAALLEDIAKSEENHQIDSILKGIRAQLVEGLGVTHEDFVEIPALFRDGVAVIPNCVNGLICNGHAILPDPLGPLIDGDDPFAAHIRRRLADVGVKTHFVDIWEPYHIGAGEIHCGTNAIRRLRSPVWWQAACSQSSCSSTC